MRNIFILALLFIVVPVWATDLFDWEPVKVRTAQDGLRHWVRAEAYRDRHPSFGREKIMDVAKFTNSQVLASFPQNLYQDDSADAGLMVLFYAPDWQVLRKTPVLLIHGAGDDAMRAWVHPLSLTTPETIPSAQEGFMQKLVRAGYPTFAINFSHNHGCNYKQAEQIYNAIQVIKRRTGADKVHLIAHSKGNCAASIYVCGGLDVNPEAFGFLSRFNKDVSVYVQLAPGNKGIDLIFRYYSGSLFTLTSKLPSPVCFYRALIYGLWQDYYEGDIYLENPGEDVGNYYPGQCQLLYNLVDDGLDFSVYSYTPVDMNMTMRACYYGGSTMFVSCYGIQYAIKEGHSTIAKINSRGMDPSVALVNIYGTDPVIQEIDLGFIKIPMGVPDHPSDGLVYVHSARYIDGLLKRGAKLLGQKGYDANHFGVAIRQNIFDWITTQFAKVDNQASGD